MSKDKPSKETLEKLYISERKTISDISKIIGIERHTVSKYLNLYGIKIRKSRAKIDSPSKNDLIKLYENKKLSIMEIGEIYGVHKKAVKSWFKKHNINIIPNSQKKYHHVRKKPLTKRQKSIVIGLMLGDGSMTHSKLKRISVAHCEKQLSYLHWLKDNMGEIVPYIKKRTRDKWSDSMYYISSVCHQNFNPIHDLFYDNNKKVIKNNLVNHIDDLALAVWFMDDGSSKKDKFGITYCSKISTEGFTFKENQILQDILRIKFGIRTKICEYQRHGKKYNYLSINKKNAVKLTRIIEKHVINCMKYKLVYDRSSTTEC